MVLYWQAEAMDLIARKKLEDETGLGTFFPYVTGPGGWKTMPASLSAGYTEAGWGHGNWCSGSWVGLLLAAHLRTRDVKYSSSPTAIASALLNMADLHPAPQRAAMWKARALAILQTLCSDYLALDPRHRGILMHGCYSRPPRIGVDSVVLFRDYYFAEAMCKIAYPGRLTPVMNRLTDRVMPI